MAPTACAARSYLATDGYLDPSLLTTALVDGARAGRRRVFTHTRVTGDRRRQAARRVRGVQTEWGPIEAEIVVNAGGMFAAEIGRMAGVRVPIVPFAHEYLVTQPFRERAADGEHLPTLRDPDLLIYFREEGGGLVMGGYERALGAVGARRAPARRDPGRTSTAACSRRTGRASRRSRANSRRRVPVMDEITVTRLINGPGGVHARQRVLPRRDRGRAASSSPPASAPTGSRARAASAR